MEKINSKTIVFIHGAFITKDCWADWVPYFSSKGYTCIAPAWPFKNAPAAELRAGYPDPEIASLRLTDLITAFTQVIQAQTEKPILIGHSLGGMLTQILLNRGLAAAGVAIHSLPPKGVIPTQLDFYLNNWRALGFFTDTHEAYMMSLKNWRSAFTNGMPEDVQEATYNALCAPESKLLVRDTMGDDAYVDYAAPHAPLLFTSGTTDTCLPASLNLTNFKKYTDRSSITEYKEFPGRNHFVLGQPTWKEDAEAILDWITTNSVATPTAAQRAMTSL